MPLREPPSPFADRVGRSAHAQADVLVLRAFRSVQNDPRPFWPAPPRSLFVDQDNRCRCDASHDRARPDMQPCRRPN